MIKVPKKRGRPPKEAAKAAVDKRSPDEILSDISKRFKLLASLTEGAARSDIRSLVATGGPGVGKTFTIEQILTKHARRDGIRYEIVRGAISAVNLYKLAWRMKDSNCVSVLDDADSIFNDEDALNILKVLCDSSESRTVSWMKESNALREDDIPTSFEFNGAMIFISNLDFQAFVDSGKNRYVPHIEALMGRSLYLDLRLHTRDELGIWVEHIAQVGGIFEREGLSARQGKAVLQFLRKNRNELRELSIRTVTKLAQVIKTEVEWEDAAQILFLRN